MLPIITFAVIWGSGRLIDFLALDGTMHIVLTGTLVLVALAVVGWSIRRAPAAEPEDSYPESPELDEGPVDRLAICAAIILFVVLLALALEYL